MQEAQQAYLTVLTGMFSLFICSSVYIANDAIAHQLTQILDILGTALDQQGIKWIRLDGSTRVDERQQLVDEFTEDESIKVFLLSTRAGGMGYVKMMWYDMALAD